MIELFKLYWKANRLSVALIVTIIIFVTNLFGPQINPKPDQILNSIILGLQNIGLYLIMTPVIMGLYYIYKKQQIERNPGIKMNIPEIFNRDNFIAVYTAYAVFSFIMTLLMNNIFDK